MSIKAYFYHEASDSFFVDDFNSEFEVIEEIVKIGLVRKNNPSVNGLMAKILRRGWLNTEIFRRAMEVHHYIEEKKNFE